MRVANEKKGIFSFYSHNMNGEKGKKMIDSTLIHRPRFPVNIGRSLRGGGGGKLYQIQTLVLQRMTVKTN